MEHVAFFPFFLLSFGFPMALGLAFLLAIAWTLFWKIVGLWHAARHGDFWWFIVLAFINTLGILELIYLFYVRKMKWEEIVDFHKRG